MILNVWQLSVNIHEGTISPSHLAGIRCVDEDSQDGSDV